ncbi:MAG: shikimate dehydrogenase [Candidatus Omnitrophota bacterium]
MSKKAKKIYGVIGFPVKHSLSPCMHNAAFKALGIDAEYKLFEVKTEGLSDFLNNLKNEGIFGLNVTVPHKIKVREILENKFPYDKYTVQMSPELHYVKISGAINTVKREGDKLEYWNTDAAGFLKSLEEEFDPKNKKVLLIGCGGAGRAVIASLSWKELGVKKIYVNDIRAEAINSAKEYFSQISDYFRKLLEDKLQFISTEEIPQIIKKCDLLINATPVGLKADDPLPIEENHLHKDLFVYDLIYNPAETKLLKLAKNIGAKTANGLGMLTYQGMASFEIWTNKPAPKEAMGKALLEAIK